MIDLDAAERFIWTNARLIERHRFAHLFKGAPPEPVAEAVRPYQNPDGGFGNALEPDLRTPTSQPIAVNSALEDLDEVRLDPDRGAVSVVERTISALLEGAHEAEGAAVDTAGVGVQ